MADRIKNYEINYNILSNAGQAAEGFASLLGYVEKLSGKDPSSGMARGLTKLNGEINQVVNSVNRLKTSFTEIRPEIDMSGFRSQIGQMQRAVSEFAQQTRNIMRMAMSGTDKQFAKARGAMAGDIFDAASLRHFEEQLKLLPQRISEARKAVEDAKTKYNQAVNTPITYPKGSTSEDQKNIAAAAKREKEGLLRTLNDRKKTLEQLEKQQENYQRQATNLRGSLSAASMQPVPGAKPTQTMPAGVKKAVDLIPRWQQEYEKSRALALAKRAELAKTISEPQRVEKPSWYKIKSPFGGGGIDSYMREYDQAYQRNAQNASVAQQRIMSDARTNFMAISGYNETQFNEAYRQYQAYEKFRSDWGKWVAAGKPQGQAYNQTEEYKNYRASLKRLRAAYGIQRQAEALKARMAAAQPATTGGTATGGVVGGGPLPPILGMPPQIIEQAFTGKLTLLPDIAAARALIAGEKFSANLSLVPLIAELKTKLNAETFKVNVTPQIAKTRGKGAATGGAIGTLQEEINALQQSAKAPITVGTKLDRGGLLGRAQGGYNTLQALANRHPITYKLASDGSGGFSLNQALVRLTQLAKSRPVPFRMVHDGSGAFSLNQALARLQALASTRPIAISLNANVGNLSAAINQALTSKGGPKSYPIDLKPRAGELSKSIRTALNGTGGTPRSFFVDIKARTGQLVNSISRALRGKSFNIDAKLNTNNLAGQVPILERLQRVWAQLPKTGKRTYTINLKTTGLENISRIERVIALVNSLPASRTKNYNVNTGSGVRGGAGGGTTIGAIGGSRMNPVYTKTADDLYTRSRRWAYPFTGNTSFGARTPAAFDMMKGMGMMMGIGGAMGVIGGSFSDAVGYQNTMETAKAILRDNYRGSNFNQDYDDMVRVVRDVAMRTKFTAPEAADAARFMAMAGLDIPMIKSAIAPIADVAAISDTDLGLVADKMTNIMTEFKVAPAKMRNLADMMTKTFTSTNTDMMMLAESLQYAGPMAFASGQSLAETLAMIGIMGNSGIQASMAGTTMRMMLQNLYNPNKNQAKFMQSIGLQTRDANGNRRSLYQILSDISRLTGSNDSKNVIGNLLAGKDAKNNIDTFDAASKLFRVTAAAGGASLLGNIDKVGDLITKIQSASGNSEAVSLAKQNTVAGQWAQAKSAFTEAVVKVFEDSNMQKLLKDSLGKLIDYLKQPEFIDTIKKIFDLIVNVFDVLKTVVKAWMWVYDKFGGIVNEVIKWQFIFTNLGYAITPFIQLIGLFSTFGNTLRGIFGTGGGAVALASAVRAGGMTTGLSSVMRDGLMIGALNATARTREVVPDSAFYRLGIQQERAERRYGATSNNVKGGRFAQVYAERAARYRAAYRTQYDLIGAAAAGIPMSMAYPEERVAFREMLGRRDRLRMMADQYGLLAMQSAMINRQRKASQIKNTDLLYRAARQGRLSWGNLGRGMGSAFTTAFTANTMSAAMGGAWASIKGGFTSVATTLAKGAGLLLNPVTLAAGALGGLAIAAGVAAYNFYKQNEAWQQGIKNSGVQFREELQKAWGSDTSLKDVFEHIKTINVNSASINVNEGEIAKAVSKIAEDENLKSIYEVLNSKIREDIDGTLGIADTKLSGVSKGTFKEAYNQYISPMRSVMGNLPSFEQFLSYIEKGDVMSSIDETKAAAAITQAIIGQKGTQSGRYAQAEQKVLELTKDFNTLSVSEQIAQWDAYRQQILGIAEGFNPKNHPNLVPVTSGNFQQALSGSPAQYYEYWLGSYNSIMRFIDESPALKAIQAIHTLNSGVEERTEEWWDAIIDIIGATSFNDEHYNGIRDFTIPTKNGQIDYSRLTQKISATGERLNNSVYTYMQWVSQIYDIIFSNEGIAQQLNGVNFPSKEEIIRRLFGSESLPKWIRDSFTVPTTTGWGTWNAWNKNPIDSRVDSFLGTQRNGTPTPTTPSPGPDYEWNPYINTWVKRAGSSTTTTPSPTGGSTSTTHQTVPQPTAYTPKNLNSGYESSYAQSAARPTQVVINIDKLMNTDKMMIASDAEERQLAGMMEDKIEQALDILKGQIVMSLQRGNYELL